MLAPNGPILDPRITTVIDRLHAMRKRPPNGGAFANLYNHLNPFDYPEYGFSIIPEQGDLIYLLCRSLGARRVAEFATSLGMSTLYFAAAIRDNGGGMLIGSELVPEKVATARRNLAEAGLERFAEIREGDARQTLRDLGGEIDFLLIDGWPGGEGESLALQVMRIVAPQLRTGGMVMNDNGEADYLEYVRNPANGFRSMSLPLKGSTELSVKTAS